MLRDTFSDPGVDAADGGLVLPAFGPLAHDLFEGRALNDQVATGAIEVPVGFVAHHQAVLCIVDCEPYRHMIDGIAQQRIGARGLLLRFQALRVAAVAVKREAGMGFVVVRVSGHGGKVRPGYSREVMTRQQTSLPHPRYSIVSKLIMRDMAMPRPWVSKARSGDMSR